MTTELREKLTSDVLGCTWYDLAAHHKRDGLLMVRPDLDLIDAAVALATNRADRLEVWLAIGRIWRPDSNNAAELKQRQPRFQFVIVQPWVLAQELPEALEEA